MMDTSGAMQWRPQCVPEECTHLSISIVFIPAATRSLQCLLFPDAGTVVSWVGGAPYAHLL